MIERDAIFVLGAQDPEMREIARVLRKHARPFYHAAKGGRLVSTRTAYEADGVIRLSRSGRSGEGLLLPRDPAHTCIESLPANGGNRPGAGRSNFQPT